MINDLAVALRTSYGARRILLTLMMIICVAISSEDAISQPAMASAKDCLDWFRIATDRLHENYYCLGKAHVSGSGAKEFFDIDWFEVGRLDENLKSAVYREARQIGSNGENTNVWEKSLRRNKELLHFMGSYNGKLRQSEPAVYDEKGKYVRGLVGLPVPEPFMLTLLGQAIFSANGCNRTTYNQIVDKFKLLESKAEDGKIIGFFVAYEAGVEVTFSEEDGWMPIKSRTYYLEPGSTNPVAREQFVKVHADIETQWICMNEIKDDERGVFVPAFIKNVQHSMDISTEVRRDMEIHLEWKVGSASEELLSEDAADKVRHDRGPLAEVKRDLIKQSIERMFEPR